jgi:hypothetical protein
MVGVNGSAELARPRPGLGTRQAALLLIVAAGAWAATVALARGMAGMTGTMGLGPVVFVPVWTLMMAAMMLPSGEHPALTAILPKRSTNPADRHARKTPAT